jgi:hypothetical protein
MRTMLWSLAAAAVFAVAASGALPAEAAKKHKKAAADGQASSQGSVGSDHAWGSHPMLFGTRPSGRSKRKARRLQAK